jgi:NAD(P) transhydrogenase
MRAVIITVLNAYSGLALVAEGLMLNNSLLTSVGSLIAASGSILSYVSISLRAAANRSSFAPDHVQGHEPVNNQRVSAPTHSKHSLTRHRLFGGIASTGPQRKIEGTVTQTNIEEVVEDIKGSESVIIVVGYGMATARAQHAIAEIVKLCQSKGIKIRFAIHVREVSNCATD